MTESDKRNLILTGFMGTGKTTTGKLVAMRLDRIFFDMDSAIEHRTGLTIPRIFAQYSEPFFRGVERGLCYELAMQEELVIATGGGALIDPESYDAMNRTGFIICLTASPEIIESRLRQSDDRPLVGEWRERLLQRQAAYDAMPNSIDTTDKTPEIVAGEVIDLWQTASQ